MRNRIGERVSILERVVSDFFLIEVLLESISVHFGGKINTTNQADHNKTLALTIAS